MSNAEHLIENAIVCIENKEGYEAFSKAKYNVEMSKMSQIHRIFLDMIIFGWPG